MKFFNRHIFGLLTIALITILSLMPAQEFPQVDVQFADKWTHWLMYGFLTAVLGIEVIGHSRRRKAHCAEQGTQGRTRYIPKFFLIFLFSCMFGGLMELGQAYLTTTRSGEWLDFLANSFGALCSTIVLCIYVSTVKEKDKI